MPAARQAATSSGSVLPVIATNGSATAALPPRLRQARVALRPSRPGICTSISTASTGWAAS